MIRFIVNSGAKAEVGFTESAEDFSEKLYQ